MLVVFALIAAFSLPPKPDHYVTDRTGVLGETSTLNAKLAEFERQTSDQILVYVDTQLPADTTIEEMGSEAIKQWGVGQKGKDNGAILFVFVNDHKMRIEVGYGLEGALTDAKSRNIIETVIKPQFKEGDYRNGVDQGVAAIIATIRGEPYKGSGSTVAEGSQSTGSWFDSHYKLFYIAFIVAFILVGRLFAWLFRGVAGSTFSGSGANSSSSWSSWSSSSSWSSDSSFSSSSSSSDSFSGGGGSGGGGGASGSW